MEYNQIGETRTPRFSSTHERLLSFAFSAMLTSAFLATAPEGMMTASAGPNIQAIFTQIQVSGFPGAASLSKPASVTIPASAAVDAPATQPAPPLSMEQLQKIRRNLEERNKRFTVDPTVSYLLGLTKKGDSLILLGRALKDSQGVTHSIYLLEGNKGYIVTLTMEDKSGVICRVDKDLKLMTAVKKPADGSGFQVLPLPEAAKTLHAELSTWAIIADTFLDEKPKVASATQP
ncbi:MAG: hypothetical protein Q8T11_11315 [Elusimicrobiota bacterium]|nr:hypothetical protein [Elusimicrobiota bacterium]